MRAWFSGSALVGEGCCGGCGDAYAGRAIKRAQLVKLLKSIGLCFCTPPDTHTYQCVWVTGLGAPLCAYRCTQTQIGNWNLSKKKAPKKCSLPAQPERACSHQRDVHTVFAGLSCCRGFASARVFPPTRFTCQVKAQRTSDHTFFCAGGHPRPLPGLPRCLGVCVGCLLTLSCAGLGACLCLSSPSPPLSSSFPSTPVAPPNPTLPTPAVPTLGEFLGCLW